jgi:hypothetical protein
VTFRQRLFLFEHTVKIRLALGHECPNVCTLLPHFSAWGALIEMRRRVLLVAAELDLRARFARELQSSGYAVELACDMKRALRLTADDHFRLAIVAPGASLANFATLSALREAVPQMIVLAEAPDEIALLASLASQR